LLLRQLRAPTNFDARGPIEFSAVFGSRKSRLRTFDTISSSVECQGVGLGTQAPLSAYVSDYMLLNVRNPKSETVRTSVNCILLMQLYEIQCRIPFIAKLISLTNIFRFRSFLRSTNLVFYNPRNFYFSIDAKCEDREIFEE